MSIIKLSLLSSFSFGLAGMAFNRPHLLSVLLCLEGMMLSLFIASSFWIVKNTTLAFSSWPLILLTFSACEAGTGLALLTATSRTHGSDRVSSLNLLQC